MPKRAFQRSAKGQRSGRSFRSGRQQKTPKNPQGSGHSGFKREWMGIEPTQRLFSRHTGFEAQGGHATSTSGSNGLENPGPAAGPLTGPESPKSADSGSSEVTLADPELARIVDAWPDLPEAIRAGPPLRFSGG